MVVILGLMEEYIKEIGSIIKCMVVANINGKMVVVTKANTITIKNMDMVFIHGLMAEDMKDTGKMVKGKEEVNIFYQLE
jgi:hypothetical protein